MMSNSVTDVFKSKLKEARAEQEAHAVPMEFAGFPCKVIPLPLNVWMRSGRMPEALTHKYLTLAAKGDDSAAPQLSPEEALGASAFRRVAVCRVVVEPSIIPEGQPADGELLYADIVETAPAFVAAVFDWIQLGCPMLKEGEEGEALTGADLGNFPDKPQRSEHARPRAARKSRGAKAVGAAAAD
jgi:hypothetical protein